QVELPGQVGGPQRLGHGAGEAVQDVPAAGGGGGHHGEQQVEHDLIRDQVAAALAIGDLTAERGAGRDLGAQHVTRGNVRDAELGGEPFALGTLAATRSGD